jgi:hypothetical protein
LQGNCTVANAQLGSKKSKMADLLTGTHTERAFVNDAAFTTLDGMLVQRS